jgi:hypothetical protein
MWRWVLGIFLILHGVTHAFWPSYGATASWLVGEAPSLSVVLWAAATLLFVATGLALILKLSWWRRLAVVAAVESLVLLGLFGQPGQVVGFAIDAGVLVALLWARWPSSRAVGA